MWFDKIKYVQDKKWEGDDFLVQPQTGTKRCRVCRELQYTSAFPDWAEYVDGKLPVCRKCARTEAGKRIVAKAGYVQVCRRCKEERPLQAFNPRRLSDNYRKREKVVRGRAKSYRGGENPYGMTDVCQICSKEAHKLAGKWH